MSEVRKRIGYCPQFDPLLPTMTGRETLTMYARLRGIAAEYVPVVCDNILNRLGLSEFADRQAGAYSGGMKRKLSLGIALIGQPTVVFLDEPSTGMDPASRRFLWSVLADIARNTNTSMILTTHSMEV